MKTLAPSVNFTSAVRRRENSFTQSTFPFYMSCVGGHKWERKGAKGKRFSSDSEN